jgi:hypothetical protein
MSDLTYHRLKYSTLVWVALAFGIFALVGFYSARMTNDYQGYDHDRVQLRLANKDQVDKAEEKQLNPVDDQGHPTAAWVDQDKGVIQIPINEAVTHELADLKSVPPGPGAALPVVAPAPPPPASAPATNAAPAKPAPPASTNAAPAKPAAPPAPAAKPKKKKPATAGATPVTSTILTPGEINQPVFNTQKIKTAPGTTFQGFITYGSPLFISGNTALKSATTGTN